MKVKEKLKRDDFISLDYNRIKEEVRENIEICKPIKTTKFHKYLKYGIISISAFIIVIIAALFLPGTTSRTNKYLRYKAAPQKDAGYLEFRDEQYLNFLNKFDNFSATISSLIYEEYKDEKENFIISPVSIYMGLAMLVETTDGIAREEILNALGMTYDDVSTYTKLLYAQLNEEDSTQSVIGIEKKMFEKNLKNSIWIDDNINFNEETLKTLADKYNCSSYSAPFKDANRRANKAIKDYVSNSTRDLINQNFKLSKETLFTLINTFYLKDTWNYDGDELLFSKNEYLFNNLTSVPFLEGYYKNGKVYETENAKHFFTTTYKNLIIKFIVPKDGYDIDDIYNKELLKEMNNVSDYLAIDHERLEINHTRCIFPEFETSFDNNIASILKEKLGVSKVFEFGNNCNPLTQEKVKLGDIQHVAKLQVNRKGIEGSSVITIPGAGAPGPSEYVDVYYDFVIDQSFIVMVTDYNDVTLFSGVIYNV